MNEGRAPSTPAGVSREDPRAPLEARGAGRTGELCLHQSAQIHLTVRHDDVDQAGDAIA
jgi:hypothetical protein